MITHSGNRRLLQRVVVYETMPGTKVCPTNCLPRVRASAISCFETMRCVRAIRRGHHSRHPEFVKTTLRAAAVHFLSWWWCMAPHQFGSGDTMPTSRLILLSHINAWQIVILLGNLLFVSILYSLSVEIFIVSGPPSVYHYLGRPWRL